MFSKGVEAAIRAAMERGEFDDLPGAGKRVDLGAYFETPEDLRLAQSVLRNAGMVPHEMELMHQISDLQEQTGAATSEEERLSATQRLQALRLRLSLRMERLSRKHTAR